MTPMDRTDEDGASQVERVRNRLLDQIQQSVTSAAMSGRTVESPREAAGYVVNALTVHYTGLLAEAAVTFDREAVEALLSGPGAACEGPCCR